MTSQVSHNKMLASLAASAHPQHRARPTKRHFAPS